MFHFTLAEDDKAPVRLVWLHGWGQNHGSLLELAAYFKSSAENVMFDLAGFGQSPEPPEAWSTSQYGEEIMNIIAKMKPKKTVIVGHSFGGRVAIRIAARYIDKIDGVILIAGAGVKPVRSVRFKIKAFILKHLARIYRKWCFLKKLPLVRGLKFGSPDYQAASPLMKKVLVKAVNEDLLPVAARIKCPALFVYGQDDYVTPSYFGKKYSEVVKNSRFVEIPAQEHNSLLGEGRYQVENLMEEFLSKLK